MRNFSATCLDQTVHTVVSVGSHEINNENVAGFFPDAIVLLNPFSSSETSVGGDGSLDRRLWKLINEITTEGRSEQVYEIECHECGGFATAVVHRSVAREAQHLATTKRIVITPPANATDWFHVQVNICVQ